MKCRYCGKEIPEGALYCKACGREVFIVPEYNPLDDMLTEQIRDSIDGTGREEDYLVYDDASFQTRATSARRNTGRTVRTGSTGKMENTGRTRNTGRMKNTGRTAPLTKEQKRRQAEKRKKKGSVDHGADSYCDRRNQYCSLSKFLYRNCGERK